MRAACGLTGFEIREEKVEGPETCLQFLGVEVDTIAWEVRIGEKKLQSLGLTYSSGPRNHQP